MSTTHPDTGALVRRSAAPGGLAEAFRFSPIPSYEDNVSKSSPTVGLRTGAGAPYFWSRATELRWLPRARPPCEKF